MHGNSKSYSIRPLTAEEKEFASDNLNYRHLFYFMKKRNLDQEEWYDILIIPYLNCVKRYHECEEIRKYAFSTILERKLFAAVSAEYRKRRAKKRMPEGGICSLDFTLESDNSFSESQIEAWLTDHRSNVERQVIFKELFKEFYEKCITYDDDFWGEDAINEYVKCELDLLLAGYTHKQVWRKTEKKYPYGYKEQDLEFDLRGIRRIFKEVFGI